MKLLIILVLCAILSAASGARILCFFYFPSVSHQYVFGKIAKDLSLRGHEVTFVTPNPMKNPKLVNLTEIDVSEAYKMFEKIDVTNFNADVQSTVEIFLSYKAINEEALKIELSSPQVGKLLQKPSDSFDLILIEIHSSIPYGLQHKFKAPLIVVSSMGSLSIDQHVFGNSIHPVLYPDILLNFDKPILSLWDKLSSLYFTTMELLVFDFHIYPSLDKVARQYFGQDMPYLKELVKNASMLMLNINPIFSSRRPNAPNVIEFFNIHDLNRDKIVAKDLQQILDNAKEGVVYFSLGTNVRFDHVQGDIKKSILEALGSLPYTVLCKWESESVAGQPKNVHLRKWFPQQAVLAHPNVKVFVTQGGLQSSEEAIINAVPLVVIPFLGDQPLNAKILTSNGMAETISPKEMNKDLLKRTILQVAKDEKYRKKAKELRSIFLDQPQSGIDKVIWWCEYVIRHKGAKHLRSPGADLPLHEYFMLDVLAVAFLAFFVTYKLVKFTIQILFGLFKKSTGKAHPEKTAPKKKKN